MRIGIDIRLQNESGVGRYIRNLVEWLPKIDKKNEYSLIAPKIRWHSLKEQILFPRVLEKEGFDLVHFPYFSVPTLYKRPFVVTIHDLTINHFPTGKASTLSHPVYLLKHLGYRFVLNQAIKNAKKIIVPSKSTKKEILEHFKAPEEKVVVAYEGVDFGKIDKRPHLRNAKSPIQKESYFLYVGNAYPHKNLKRLVEAFQSAINPVKSSLRSDHGAGNQQSTISNLKLVLVGREDYFYTRLKKKVKEMGLSNQVIFYGEANDQELSWLYQNAIALVLPSLMEGFGLPALEAMACGSLVLASDIPALKEVCGEVAIYFKPEKIEEIIDALYKAMNVSAKSKYQRRELAKERAKLFSWQKMAEQTLRVYESCFSL